MAVRKIRLAMSADSSMAIGNKPTHKRGCGGLRPLYVQKRMKFMKNKGFSLVELIVVIAIMAILVGVAVPVYTGYIEKAETAVKEQYLSDVVYAAQLFAAENGLVLHKIAIAPRVDAENKQGVELFAKDGEHSYRVEDLTDFYATIGSYNTEMEFDYYYTPDTTEPNQGDTTEGHTHVFEVVTAATCVTDGREKCKTCEATRILSASGHEKGSLLFVIGNLEVYACNHAGCDYQIVEPQGNLIG